ncbi:hypothetical protein ASC89_04410 [Devosia sp. Root413D1]|uniref:ATP-dependent DNA ligase n=1 Tax=Devosia sp. Root413D1 TaxID=1736531 RepID=UPI0006F8C91A|nr:RNA ligase family protein [Devosia sp. Root413D1]KQW81080.1 hypothetical protein ASC89_04410 [Devosia sp. Root413D1]
MKPRLVETALTGDGWLHEVKFDGYRTQLHVEAGNAKAFSSSGATWTSKYPQIVAAAAQLPCTSAILDGEVYLPDIHGASDFTGLPSAIRWHPEQLIFVAFDLLHLDGEDIRGRPIESRRAMLADLLQSAPAHPIAFSAELEADGPAAFAAIDAMGLEGIVSKKRGSRYKSGEADTWLKTKTFTVSELEVIGADVTPSGAPVAILARRDEHGLHFVGDAFITLKAADREDFWAYAEANTAEAPALPLKRRGTWLRPGLIAKVRHLRGEGMLRHATLKGLRHDHR